MKPYYSEEGITIFHGNSLEIIPSLSEVDLILTDPPYSAVTMNNALTYSSEEHGLGGTTFVPFSITEETLREILLKAAEKLKRWSIVFCDWRHCASFGDRPPVGLKFVRFGIWNKPDGAPQFTGDRPALGWEAIACMHKEFVKLDWNGGGRRSVWTYNVERQANGHPTPKPLPLMNEMITLFSNKGETVLDPFMGSGTTLRAAKDLGRKAIGIEIEEKYCEIAVKRLRQEVLPLEMPSSNTPRTPLSLDLRLENPFGEVS